MEIVFAFEDVHKAANELETAASNILSGQKKLQGLATAMNYVWEGDVATNILGQVKSYNENLTEVNKYIAFLKQHIDFCKENFKYVERSNNQMNTSVADLFL